MLYSLPVHHLPSEVQCRPPVIFFCVAATRVCRFAVRAGRHRARAAYNLVGMPGAGGLVPLTAPRQLLQLELQRQAFHRQPPSGDPDDLSHKLRFVFCLTLTSQHPQQQQSAAYSSQLIMEARPASTCSQAQLLYAQECCKANEHFTTTNLCEAGSVPRLRGGQCQLGLYAAAAVRDAEAPKTRQHLAYCRRVNSLQRAGGSSPSGTGSSERSPPARCSNGRINHAYPLIQHPSCHSQSFHTVHLEAAPHALDRLATVQPWDGDLLVVGSGIDAQLVRRPVAIYTRRQLHLRRHADLQVGGRLRHLQRDSLAITSMIWELKFVP